jgi:hypothetical protein
MPTPTVEPLARRARLGRMWRRMRRRLGLIRPRGPVMRFDLSRSHELTTAELWNAWTLASLDCALELKAWFVATRGQRERAYRRYLAALAREARFAELLAERCA